MKFKNLIGGLMAASMAAAPVAAAANPASALSLGNARASSDTSGESRLAGAGAGGIFAALIVAGVIAIVAIDAADDDTPDSP